jgi:hypothetical protein
VQFRPESTFINFMYLNRSYWRPLRDQAATLLFQAEASRLPAAVNHGLNTNPHVLPHMQDAAAMKVEALLMAA